VKVKITNQDVDRVAHGRGNSSLQAAPMDSLHQPFPTCRAAPADPMVVNIGIVQTKGCFTGFSRDFSKDTMQLPGTGTFFKDTTNQRLTMFRHFDASECGLNLRLFGESTRDTSLAVKFSQLDS